MRSLVLALALLPAAAPAAPAEVPAGTLDEARRYLRAGDRDAAAAVLSPLLERFEGDAAVQARFLLGRLLVEAGSAAGRAHLEALPAPLPPVDDRRLVWLARARALDGDHAAALDALDGALRADLGDDERGELLLLRAAALDALGRADAAGEALERAASGRDVDRFHAARALRRLAERAAAAGDAAAARRHARRLLLRQPDTPAARRPGLPLAVAELDDGDRFARAERLMARFEYDEARAELERLAEHRTLGPEARWLLGVIGLRKLRDDAAGARARFERVLAEGGPHAEEALYLLMRTYLKEDRYDEALEVADRYDRAYPRGRFAERIGYYRAWMPYDQRRCDVAVPAWQRYLRRFGRDASLARGFIAWCHVRDRRWADAVRAYEELVRYGNPLVRGKAWYWQAVALDALGRRPEALAKLDRLHADYPLTWYDVLGHQLRARWEGGDPRASALAWPEGGGGAGELHPLDPGAWAWPRVRGRTEATLARVRWLVAVGEVDRARAEYRPVRAAVEAAVPRARRLDWIRFATHAVEDFKHGWDEVSGGRLAAMTDMPRPRDVRWLLAYPRAYRWLVERLEGVHGVPAPFVWAIMRQESRYHPAMVSAMDAIGALQMIPQTAERVGAELGTPYDAETFPDPRVGFPFSTFYMARHDALWHGQLVFTAASYNAGPEPVARWLRENPGADLATVVEEISYNEARAYCRKVAEHMLRYLYLYEPDAARRGALLDRLFPVTVRADVPADVGY